MIKPIVEEFKTGRSATIGPVRLSYPHLFEPDTLTGKYSCSLIIPAGEAPTLEALRRCIEQTAEIGVTTKWHGERPAAWSSPLAEDEEGDPVLKAGSKDAPKVTGIDCKAVTDPEEIYGGCWVLASVGFAPYEFGGKKGVTCYIKALRKVRDDSRFGADASAELNGINIDEYLVDDDDL